MTRHTYFMLALIGPCISLVGVAMWISIKKGWLRKPTKGGKRR